MCINSTVGICMSTPFTNYTSSTPQILFDWLLFILILYIVGKIIISVCFKEEGMNDEI